MDYIHFIITQFNLRNFPGSDGTNFSKWVQWTHDRLDLFYKYCFPSVINQTCKSFTWLIYFDKDTPEEFSDILKELESHNFIKVCYSKGFEGFQRDYTQSIKANIPSNVRWVITTRIDNDDCLHKDAVKIIQENKVYRHKYLISLASGYTLNISDFTMSHYFYPMSPFISLIENYNNHIDGVFEKGHTMWPGLRLYIFKEIWREYFSRKSRKVRFILNQPLWIQIVHGRNVSNSFYRGLPVIGKRDLHDFSLNITTEKQSWVSIFKYPNYVTWKRYVKSSIVKLLLQK